MFVDVLARVNLEMIFIVTTSVYNESENSLERIIDHMISKKLFEEKHSSLDTDYSNYEQPFSCVDENNIKVNSVLLEEKISKLPCSEDHINSSNQIYKASMEKEDCR